MCPKCRFTNCTCAPGQSERGPGRVDVYPARRRRTTPGNGWRQIGPSVWERRGSRVHMLGMLVLPDGSQYWAHCLAELPRWDRCLAQVGGNRRRATLSWAREIMDAR